MGAQLVTSNQHELAGLSYVQGRVVLRLKTRRNTFVMVHTSRARPCAVHELVQGAVPFPLQSHLLPREGAIWTALLDPVCSEKDVSGQLDFPGLQAGFQPKA
jgi:hypothetical protein